MSVNTQNPNNMSQSQNYEIVDVDSPQDKKAAAYVQSCILKAQDKYESMEEFKMAENNNNNGMSIQDQLALQQLQNMQNIQQAGEKAGSVLMTGLKYGAAFGAGFLGCKLLNSNNTNSKDTSDILGCVNELFK